MGKVEQQTYVKYDIEDALINHIKKSKGFQALTHVMLDNPIQVKDVEITFYYQKPIETPKIVKCQYLLSPVSHLCVNVLRQRKTYGIKNNFKGRQTSNPIRIFSE